MNKEQLQRLRSLPVEAVAERLGLRVVRHKSLCPFHDDHHASLSYSPSRNTFRCFVCDARGGTIDLVMRHLNMSFPDACRWLANGTNIILDTYRPRTPTVDRPARPFDAARYARLFEHPWLSDEARTFLFTERRLDPRVISWCRLTSWTDRQGTHWLQTPYFDASGQLIGLQNRNLDYVKHRGDEGEETGDEGKVAVDKGYGSLAKGKQEQAVEAKPEGREAPRFRFPYGSRCTVYNLPVTAMLRPGEPLFITEGCSDCWAMLSAGHKAIAIPSATLLSQADKALLRDLAQRLGTSFHMFPDRDAPGERLFMQLKEVLPGLQHHQLPPGCKDFAEYYVSALAKNKLDGYG